MRISDWSSDVCSSDLSRAARRPAWVRSRIRSRSNWASEPKMLNTSIPPDVVVSICSVSERKPTPRAASSPTFSIRWLIERPRRSRSEEHTSELQSLMRISYAVFCLKKKKHTDKRQTGRTKDGDMSYTQQLNNTQ